MRALPCSAPAGGGGGEGGVISSPIPCIKKRKRNGNTWYRLL